MKNCLHLPRKTKAVEEQCFLIKAFQKPRGFLSDYIVSCSSDVNRIITQQ